MSREPSSSTSSDSTLNECTPLRSHSSFPDTSPNNTALKEAWKKVWSEDYRGKSRNVAIDIYLKARAKEFQENSLTGYYRESTILLDAACATEKLENVFPASLVNKILVPIKIKNRWIGIILTPPCDASSTSHVTCILDRGTAYLKSVYPFMQKLHEYYPGSTINYTETVTNQATPEQLSGLDVAWMLSQHGYGEPSPPPSCNKLVNDSFISIIGNEETKASLEQLAYFENKASKRGCCVIL